MQEFLAQLDFGVVEAILTGVAGFTIKMVVSFIKSKVSISGIWTNIVTLVVGAAFTAAYLLIFATFVVDLWTGYSVLVFLVSILGHNTVKTILEALRNRQPA